MDDPKNLSQAIATLTPLAQAIVDVSANAAILGELEERIARANESLANMQRTAQTIQANANKSVEEAKAKENEAKASALSIVAEARSELTKAKTEAESIVATARRDAIAEADGIKQARQKELDELASAIETTKAEYRELAQHTSEMQREHDAVQASMASLKTRLG